MDVDLVLGDVLLEVLVDLCYLIGYLADDELSGDVLLTGDIALDDAAVVEEADLLKGGLVDVPFHLAVDVCESFNPGEHLLADRVHIQVLKSLVELGLVDGLEGKAKQLLNEDYLHDVDFILDLGHEVSLDSA